jgi:hypothetical protein
MKYISLVIMLVLMSWTWCLATSERSFGLEEHKRVEAGVEDDIRGFIGRKFPQTSNINCQQLYTEEVESGVRMKAHFRCQATGPMNGGEVSNQTFEGILDLKSDDGFKTWSETGGDIHSPEISFVNGLHVSAKEGDSGADSAPEATPAPSSGTEK